MEENIVEKVNRMFEEDKQDNFKSFLKEYTETIYDTMDRNNDVLLEEISTLYTILIVKGIITEKELMSIKETINKKQKRKGRR